MPYAQLPMAAAPALLVLYLAAASLSCGRRSGLVTRALRHPLLQQAGKYSFAAYLWQESRAPLPSPPSPSASAFYPRSSHTPAAHLPAPPPPLPARLPHSANPRPQEPLFRALAGVVAGDAGAPPRRHTALPARSLGP